MKGQHLQYTHKWWCTFLPSRTRVGSIPTCCSTMKTYTNLVFKGGGVKGIAYVGALKILDQQGILATITRVAGTSAGSILATLLAVGYTPDEILGIMNELDFSSLKDHWDPLRVPEKYGLYAGSTFLDWIEGQITKKAGAGATFTRLKGLGMKDLRVVATDISTEGKVIFSVDTTPDVIVSEAVRASMSIPGFFEAWVFSQGMPDRRVYMDGGVVWNYPLTIFGSEGETLGLCLMSPSVPVIITYGQGEKCISALFNTVLNAQNVDFMADLDQVARTIQIPGMGISATNFSLTQEQKTGLLDSGTQATINFLKAA